MVSVRELHDIVDWKEGLISPAVLFDNEVYRQEQERVFGRAWLVVGHEDMVRYVNYVLNKMRDGAWQASYNQWIAPVLGQASPPQIQYQG